MGNKQSRIMYDCMYGNAQQLLNVHFCALVENVSRGLALRTVAVFLYMYIFCVFFFFLYEECYKKKYMCQFEFHLFFAHE